MTVLWKKLKNVERDTVSVKSFAAKHELAIFVVFDDKNILLDVEQIIIVYGYFSVFIQKY